MINAIQGMTSNSNFNIVSGSIILPSTYVSTINSCLVKGYINTSYLNSPYTFATSSYYYLGVKLDISPGTWFVIGTVYLKGDSTTRMKDCIARISKNSTSPDSETGVSSFVEYGIKNTLIEIILKTNRIICSNVSNSVYLFAAMNIQTGTSAQAQANYTNLTAIKIS